MSGSQQLRLFRRDIFNGAPIDIAATLAGISLTEARLCVEDDRRNPPAADAYRLLGHGDTIVALCGPWGRA